MSRSTDRDLLFGLLALQNNFIDRDALVDAFHRWTGDRASRWTRSSSTAAPLAEPALRLLPAWSQSISSGTAATRRRAWPPSARSAR